MPLTKTKIKWVINPNGEQGYGANPIRGQCCYNCDYCYAEAQRKRLNHPAEISWHPNVLLDIEKLKKPSTVFIGSMHDIFGDWVEEIYLQEILDIVVKNYQHTFLFLTKNAYRLVDRKIYNPNILFNLKNVWLGATVTNGNIKGGIDQIGGLMLAQHNQLYLSAEPLLGDVSHLFKRCVPENLTNLRWLIIGTLNQNGRPVPAGKGGTKLEWIVNLVEQALKFKIPIFMKGECYTLYPELSKMFGELKALPYLETIKW